ncbi:helical hairpin domain-containing protein [Streptococcus pneumoniae]|nr:helical hairpin domain-containing protein [Streptococcus pneumoniae]
MDKFNCSMVLSYRLLLFIIFLFNLFAKMNLTSTIKLEQVEKEIEENQRFMTKWIDDYEYKVRRLENFINILDNTRNQNVTKLERETKSV